MVLSLRSTTFLIRRLFHKCGLCTVSLSQIQFRSRVLIIFIEEVIGYYGKTVLIDYFLVLSVLISAIEGGMRVEDDGTMFGLH